MCRNSVIVTAHRISQFKFPELCFSPYAETINNAKSFRSFGEHQNRHETHLICNVTPFDSLHMVSCYHPIVTLRLKCTVFKIW